MKIHKLTPVYLSSEITKALDKAKIHGWSRESFLDSMDSLGFYICSRNNNTKPVPFLWRLSVIPLFVWFIICRIVIMPLKWLFTGNYWFKYSNNSFICEVNNNLNKDFTN